MSDEPTKKQLQVAALAGYPPEIGRCLWMLEDTRRRTQEALKDLYPLIIDWHASDRDNTIGTLLYHIAAIELDWLYAEVLEQPFPAELLALFPYDVRDPQGRLTVVAGVSLADHLNRLDLVRATLLAVFRTITVEDFRRPSHLVDYDVTPEWVLHHLMQHEAGHRGEIGEMRRLAEQDIF